MPRYKVKGIAFVPVKVEITVIASSSASAKRKAREMFRESEKKDSFIVPGTVDEGCVFAFDPSSYEVIGG